MRRRLAINIVKSSSRDASIKGASVRDICLNTEFSAIKVTYQYYNQTDLNVPHINSTIPMYLNDRAKNICRGRF